MEKDKGNKNFIFPDESTGYTQVKTQQVLEKKTTEEKKAPSENTSFSQAQESQVASAPPPPSSPPLASPTIVSAQRKGPSWFKIFVIFALIIIAIIYSAVFYLYLQNRNLRSQTLQTEPTSNLPSATPTPSFSPSWIRIQNGNVVRHEPGKEPIILVNKNDYPSTGIVGFARVIVSPDNNLLCFEALSPAVEPAIYVSNVDGSNVRMISTNKQNCVFRSDSKSIFYINTAPKSSPVSIFQYDLTQENAVEIDLTKSSVPEGVVRRYEIVGFSADDTKIICKYEEITQEEEKTGECEINLVSGEVNVF